MSRIGEMISTMPFKAQGQTVPFPSLIASEPETIRVTVPSTKNPGGFRTFFNTRALVVSQRTTLPDADGNVETYSWISNEAIDAPILGSFPRYERVKGFDVDETTGEVLSMQKIVDLAMATTIARQALQTEAQTPAQVEL